MHRAWDPRPVPHTTLCSNVTYVSMPWEMPGVDVSIAALVAQLHVLRILLAVALLPSSMVPLQQHGQEPARMARAGDSQVMAHVDQTTTQARLTVVNYQRKS